MLKRLSVFVLFLALLVGVYYITSLNFDRADQLEAQTQIIEKEIKNVGKLVVTEGKFSEVLTYKGQKKYFMNFFSFEKKALMIVNTDVSISYDLKKIEYELDSENKTLKLINIPEPEIKIYPDIKFYDIEQSQLNEFTGKDYNKINDIVKKRVSEKIEESKLTTNAQNRLTSELAKFLILTNSLGWTLEYKTEVIDSESDFKQ